MKQIILNCHNCKDQFEKEQKEVRRQLKKGRKYFFCSLTCSTIFNRTKHVDIKLHCLWCKKEFVTTTHTKSKKCCNKSCSARYSQSFLDKEKMSSIMKRVMLNKPRLLKKRNLITKEFICKMCNNVFTKTSCKSYFTYNNPKTCSKPCQYKLTSVNSTNNPNCGGETNYKKFIYKNVWMDSSWELEIAKYMDERSVSWERNKKKHMFWWTDLNKKVRRYYPDFYLPKYNLYIDTKNDYLMKCDEYKIKQVIKTNNINLFCGNLNKIKEKLDETISNFSNL
jgi:hypothetical protein